MNTKQTLPLPCAALATAANLAGLEQVQRTTALLAPGSVGRSMSRGHWITGGKLSVTVMVKLRCVRLPEASTAVTVTVAPPIEKAVPGSRSAIQVTPGKSSVTLNRLR